ncbi:Serine/arginine repetitive matrix protein 1 [Coemansia sp. RSA 989]|nr:serine/arginine repetitive matrix 1 [Coemansia mojavensis]KAJ1738668.1 Serine/arginine repetitive matrix protein 1 [Coemansia sp. RSA 1086]KAJ1861120.1 Serine/arginine repetitive matrix protein 1 [Coemansia sp. RSA 989]KAJ1869153.1 Serine/arginine repetitive matrix protein 1 [Coemansia sp. RSA 990]KAJ2630581.1 Serine/arginine repetitive matrix protein 1 [Coemansia sp. RSA 1290]KAJ2645922.1 Serine/arginine repetitive matrix protein 1 [Coemansia sp. RSA 1250]KAJ2667725.1 Serine/arginine repe
MSSGFYRGTSIEQDSRFGDASKKDMETMSFSRLLKKTVDIDKVNMDAIKPWISDKITELLGIEDDVLFQYIINMLEESKRPDARAMQVNLSGFLEDKAQEFMRSLWAILLEAQKSQGGIPESLIRQKMEELKTRREEEEKAKERIKEANRRAREPTSDSRPRRRRWDAPSKSQDRNETQRNRSPHRSGQRDSRRYRSRSHSPDKRNASRSPKR